MLYICKGSNKFNLNQALHVSHTYFAELVSYTLKMFNIPVVKVINNLHL